MFKPGDRVIRTGSSRDRVIKGDTYEVVREITEYEANALGHQNPCREIPLDKLPEKWCVRSSPATREALNVFVIKHGYTLGSSAVAVDFYYHFPFKDQGSLYSSLQNGYTEITYDQFAQCYLNNEQMNKTVGTIPERWYIETKKGPDRDFVAHFYRSILNTSCYYDFNEISSHNEGGVSIFESTPKTRKSFGGARGTKITIEQFKQLINNHQNKNNNGTINNNEVQRHAEPIGNTSSGRGITTPSRKCTIATTNGYVGNTFRDKPSKATVVQSVLNANVLVSSHN